MASFLVQVNRDGGFANIVNYRRYSNSLWKDKPRDSDHGEVIPGDELFIYCTSNVPKYDMSIAFSVTVTTVSSDRVTFKLGEPQFSDTPLKRNEILSMVDQGGLSDVFRKCGHQGFNIAKLDPNSVELVSSLLNGTSRSNGNGVDFADDEPEVLQDYTIDDVIDEGCFLERAKLENTLTRLRDKKNLILQGPPGTGKTWLAWKLAYALIGKRDDRRVRRLQFHPSLSYEDFIRGFRPSGDGTLRLIDGPFLESAAAAEADAENDYVMVIEEINRGNPAQIFGETLTLMEADKRSEEYALALAYPKTEEERVHLPSNLYLIGTMNVADRSIAMVDLALRRRFAFIDLESTLGEVWRNWVNEQCGIPLDFLTTIERKMKDLNERIAADRSLGPQFRVGHSVVTPPPGTMIDAPAEWFRQVVETEIGPLLDEYWFDDTEKAESAKAELLADQ